MNMVTMTAPAPWPRIERAGWFWIFVALSVVAHAAFFWRVSWERAAVAVDAAPQVMTVRMVEVRPAPPEPVVEPEPVVMPPVVEPEPVLTRLPEPAVLPPPPEPAAAVVKPKPAPPKVASPAPVRPDAPAFVEARPTATANRPPHYPDLARRNGWQGLCMVRVTVNENGRPGAVSLARSSGYGILDQAALTAVKRWKFTPRMVRGVPAASTVEVPVNFSLR